MNNKFSYLFTRDTDSIITRKALEEEGIVFNLGLYKLDINNMTDYKIQILVYLNDKEILDTTIEFNNSISLNYIREGYGNFKGSFTIGKDNLGFDINDITEGAEFKSKVILYYNDELQDKIETYFNYFEKD